MSKVKNIGGYRQVYKCIECKYIQGSHNSGICIKCGGDVENRIARWLDTTTLWDTILGNYVGYWEEKNETR